MSLIEISERRKQGLNYYCDEKYSLGHKSKEPKLFQIDAIEKNLADEAPSIKVPKEEASEPQTNMENDLITMLDEPIISLHALDGISLPQNLKI